MSPALLAADAELPSPPGGLSVLSYNVLLPNSGGLGWWVPKFYDPRVPAEASAWERRKELLSRGILGAGADVVCLQETTPERFESDWDFLMEAGYDHAVHRKGELRCATFWRRERLSLEGEPRHPDRALVVALRPVHAPGRLALVVNAHLKAGAEPGRRLRQAVEALEQVDKLARALAPGLPVAAIVAGDFNSDTAATGVGHLLRGGEVTPGFREPGYPDEALTSKPKRNAVGPMLDAYAEAHGPGAALPPTMYLPNRYPFFFDEQGRLSGAARGAMGRVFGAFAGAGEVMDRAAVDRWIVAVNGQLERGSEWKKAAEIFRLRGREELREEDLVAIYEAELREGKPWGVLHDLHRCGGLLDEPTLSVWAERFDQIHYTPGPLSLVAVRRPVSEDRERQIVERGDTLPNSWHPSDHLPVGASFLLV